MRLIHVKPKLIGKMGHNITLCLDLEDFLPSNEQNQINPSSHYNLVHFKFLERIVMSIELISAISNQCNHSMIASPPLLLR